MTDRLEGYRLSQQQLLLWALHRQGQAARAWSLLRLDGPLDPERLRAALERQVARHEILRTAFRRPLGIKTPLQTIAAAGTVRWQAIDLSAADDAAAEARRQVAERLEQPYDPAAGTPLSATLLALDGRSHLLLLVLPALAADSQSLTNLFDAIADSYAAAGLAAPEAATGAGAGPGPGGSEQVQYLQFSEWQHQVAAERQEVGERRWEPTLPAGRLALAGCGGSEGTNGGSAGAGGEAGGGAAETGEVWRRATAVVEIGPEVAGLAAAAALGRGVSPRSFYLACWQLVLARLAGTERVVVSAVLPGRPDAELDGVLGPFAKPVPIAGDLAEDLAFDELLAGTERALGEAEEEIVSWPPPPADPNGDRFGFAWEAWPEQRRAGGVVFAPVEQRAETLRFTLELQVAPSARGLAARLHYAAERFAPAAVDCLAERLRLLCQRLAADPAARLWSLDALTAAERRQLLAFNSTAAAYRHDRCLHELLREQAERTPRSVAVRWRGGECTYGELDRRAERLAARLRARAAGPEVLVGVCLERSLEMVLAVLAILKAGAAFVPLDPSYPGERLARIVEQSRPRLVLSSESLRARLPELGERVLCLDGETAGAADGTDEVRQLDRTRRVPARRSGPVSPHNLAYAIFTSGSTGRPKGTMIPHQGLVNYLSWAAAYYAVAPGAACPLHSPLGFDLTLTSLFCPLLAGGCIQLVPEEQTLEGLANAIRGGGLDLIKLTPAHLEVLHELLEGGELAGAAGTLVIGGEALRAGAVAPWRDHAPRTRLVNEYGPTETVVGCCIYEVGPASPGAGVLPIGRPIANCRLFLLDGGLRSVPGGVTGEIFIGGDCLARGYLGRPDLTAEAFVPSPCGEAPGERLYRTGDLGRFLPDGNLEFLGRRDHQVKVRGLRVELGEIEAVLCEHPGVREAAVVARDEGAGGQRLVAYVTAAGAQGLDGDDLRRFLLRRLPEAMVPSVFVPLAALPLTRHGKVDRQALPAPGQDAAGGSAAYAAPRTQVEQMLAEVWAQVLGARRIGREDSFFQLGGHSLLAMQAISRIRGVFRVELAVDSFFDQPTLGALARQIEAVLRGGQAGDAAPPIVALPRRGDLPLGFSQERLWLLDQLQPGNPAYNVPSALLLAGRLDAPALARALTEVMRRHEVLRTVFARAQDRPVQVVQAAGAVALPQVDLAALGGGRADREAERITAAQARRPFVLARGPLLRTALLRLAPELHLLAATMHHIVSDGWSMDIWAGEVTALYNAFAAGRPSPLPPLPVQYADFACWQRGWLAGDTLDRQLIFWRQYLHDSPASLALPTDRPRPAVQSFRGASRTLLLAPPVSQGVRALALSEKATLFMTLAAIFKLLLWRYSGQDDVCVGTPIAGRNRAEVEPLIGFFTNTLVLRTDLAGDPSASTLVERLRRSTLAALAHQDVPFEKLVEELQPQRDRSRPPLFQAVFVLQENPFLHGRVGGAADLHGLEATALPVDTGTAKVDLHLDMRMRGEVLGATLQYSTDLFDPATADRLLHHFHNLAAAAIARPERPGSTLQMLAEEERHQLLVEWGPGRPAAARLPSFHRMFEAWAAAGPDRVAVGSSGESLTYGALNGRANRLARHLGELGVGPEVVVGICVDRSLDLVIGLLAILKAGGAFLPLDPSYPAARLASMVEDAQLPVLVAEERLLDQLPSHWAVTVRPDAGERLGRHGEANVALEPPAQGPAYVIYTSGSTGRPKGVVVQHQGLANLAAAMGEALDVRPGDRVLQFAALSFDAAVSEIVQALATGATLCVASRDTLLPGKELIELLASRQITLLTLPPSVLAALPRAGLPALATLIVAGEACPADLAAAWAAGRRLFNNYGPTEITVCATMAAGVAAGMAAGARPPIGRALSGLVVYLLDRRLEPVPIGVAGEIYVGGHGVARGYLNRPELTAERFVPDPFGGASGARLYRTGDLARFLPNGNLDFLGRTDQQVKVRGFRIEPGEVEAALARHPAVQQAVVVAQPAAGGEPGLVAYLVAGRQGAPADGELRRLLADSLPDFMVPSAFVFLDELPRTPAGKVDRAALPAMADRRAAPPPAAGGAGNPLAEMLAGLWADVLGAERIGPGENFFDLGGHSLAATRVVSRAGDLLGLDVSLSALFAHPTPAGLAAAIDGQLAAGALGRLPPVERAARGGDLPLSFAQESLWRDEAGQPGSGLRNVAAALRLRGPLDVAALARSLREIWRRHEVLRSFFPAIDGRPVARIARALPPLPVVDLRGAGEQARAERERLQAREAHRPFALARGPLTRLLLLRGSGEDLLLLVCHHLVVDLHSAEIFQRELAALYASFSRRRPSPLAELAVQYADYAHWQRRWLRGEALAAELSYWRQQLAGAVPVELPSDGERPVRRWEPAASRLLLLDAGLTAACRRLGRGEGATLFMVLLAAFQALLYGYSGQRDLVVRSPVADRRRPEIEPLIGLFPNSLLLRGDLSGDPSSAQMVGRVRATVLAAYAHQSLPFDVVAERLLPELGLPAELLSRVTFNYYGGAGAALAPGEMEAEPVALGPEVTDSDLVLVVQQDGGGLAVRWVYRPRLFRASTIGEMAERFASLLTRMAARPELRLSQLAAAGGRGALAAEGAPVAAAAGGGSERERGPEAAWR